VSRQADPRRCCSGFFAQSHENPRRRRSSESPSPDEVVVNRDPAIRGIVAIDVPGLRAELGERRVLRFATDPGGDSGIPHHVRAASAVRRLGSRLIVVQDDVSALAVMDASGGFEPLLLPVGADGGRAFDDTIGNKRLKMDLEAAVVLPDARVLAFGSGSTGMRESVVIVEAGTDVRVLHARGLYSRLRKYCRTVGTELNIEGTVIQGRRLRLFQRGNGARVADGGSGSLVFDVDLEQFLRWLEGQGTVPDILDVLQVELGSIEGVPFGFTDAALTGDGRIAFVACAEESMDVRGDGPVLGCRFGWLDDTGARVTDVIESNGRKTSLKLEGIEPRPGSSTVFDVVADMDRSDHPAWLAELRVGEWTEADAAGPADL
jgi:hypothetical protein